LKGREILKRLIIGVILPVITLGGIYIWFNINHEFTKEKWLDKPSERMNIVDDFLASYELVGMSKEMVIVLLGSDSYQVADDNGIRYTLGPEPGLFGLFSIDDAWLVIYLDKDNRVSHYEVTTD
jgi:hypothetical protein